jgi:hypothetical protein
VTYHYHVPSSKVFNSNKDNELIIIDDFLQELANDATLQNVFTKYVHHFNKNVIFLSQNLFYKGYRSISLNAKYIILMRSARDISQIGVFSKQVTLSNKLTRAYQKATAKKLFSYLFVDLSQYCDPSCRFRSNIIPFERNTHCIIHTDEDINTISIT